MVYLISKVAVCFAINDAKWGYGSDSLEIGFSWPFCLIDNSIVVIDTDLYENYLSPSHAIWLMQLFRSSMGMFNGAPLNCSKRLKNST